MNENIILPTFLEGIQGWKEKIVTRQATRTRWHGSNVMILAPGCPAMGAEELEDSEFQPMLDSIEPSLVGKKIAIFGSYDWGDGEWLRTWQARCEKRSDTGGRWTESE